MTVSGGPIFWILMALAVSAVVVFFERWFELRRAQIDWPDFIKGVVNVLESGNEALYAATCGKTRLVLLKNGTDQQREELEAAGCRCLKADLDRSGTSLKSASAANQLLKRVTDRRGDVKVWLGTSADAVGLRAFLSAAKQAEDRCLALTETT